MASQRVICGDCREVMRGMEPASVDAVVTDPPYGLEFMGKEWDKLDEGLPQEARWKGRRGGGGVKEPDPNFRKFENTPRVNYGAGRSTFKRCVKCGKRAFSGSPCRCAEPEWVIETPEGSPSSAVRMQRWHEAWLREAYRVLKPGGVLMAFGGTRTWHRLAVAIEDAGFVIFDTLMWLHGQGFPKHKTLLKPAWEPVIVAKKPGAGGLNIDAGRIEAIGGLTSGGNPTRHNNPCFMSKDNDPRSERSPGHPAGRWPPNVCLSHHPGCVETGVRRVRGAGWRNTDTAPSIGGVYGDDKRDRTGAHYADPDGYETVPAFACHPDCPVRLLDEMSGERSYNPAGVFGTAKRNAGTVYGNGAGLPHAGQPVSGYGDTGGASRFFYCSKADGQQRWGILSCDCPPASCPFDRPGALRTRYVSRGEDGKDRIDPCPRCGGARAIVSHPTQKPEDLIRWLLSLAVPPGGRVLDCFAGSGTTGVEADRLGIDAVLIDQDPWYAEIARRRIVGDAPLFASVTREHAALVRAAGAGTEGER